MSTEYESTLPPGILDLVEMSPVEDLLLELIPSKLPGIRCQSLIEDDQTFPFVLLRSVGDTGFWAGDERFLDSAQIDVQTFADGLNADVDAANLAEAVRVVMRDSRNVVVPQRGHIVSVDMISRPRRVSDWATATGPVQYADLPTGVVRYETTYNVVIRKPRVKPFAS